MARLNRRNWLKRGALFVPALFAIGRSRADIIAAGPILRPLGAAAGGGGLAFDAATLGGVSTGTTDTYAHVCSGSERGLVVPIVYLNVGTRHVVTGVTYDGVAMTGLWDFRESNGLCCTSLFLLINPASGSHNVVVTMSAAVDYFISGAISLTGMHQTTAARTAVTAGGDSTTPSATASGATTGDLVVDCVMSLGTSIVIGANQTSRIQVDNIASNGSSFNSSTQAGADGGVMSWTIASNIWSTGAVALIPA